MILRGRINLPLFFVYALDSVKKIWYNKYEQEKKQGTVLLFKNILQVCQRRFLTYLKPQVYYQKDGVFTLGDNKTHQVSVKLTTEEYGWLMKYCEKNDLSMASVIRKGFRMYRAAITQRKQKQTADKE